MHQEVIENLESIHGALLRMNRSIQAEGTFGIMKNDRWYKRIVQRGIHSVIYTQQVQKGRCEKTQSIFFTSPFVILESARRVPQGPVDLGSGTTEGRFSTPRNRTQTAKQLGFEKCPALLG